MQCCFTRILWWSEYTFHLQSQALFAWWVVRPGRIWPIGRSAVGTCKEVSVVLQNYWHLCWLLCVWRLALRKLKSLIIMASVLFLLIHWAFNPFSEPHCCLFESLVGGNRNESCEKCFHSFQNGVLRGKRKDVTIKRAATGISHISAEHKRKSMKQRQSAGHSSISQYHHLSEKGRIKLST